MNGPHRWLQTLGFCGFLALVNSSVAADPVVHDARLELKLFAADPDIVTPIGMTIDSRDRIFVIESHTHHPPADYKGPASDRIKMFTDADRDGRSDRITVFADGLREAMNLAFSPGGELFVVCAREVWALPDTNGDGICDASERRRVLRVETSNHYAHSCLLGITFSPDGSLVVSRGNNGSAAYTIHGTDGSTLSGYGDGGNVFRCRPDGSKLEEIATGFWNPFDLKYDHAGRLLLVDNDPDARGPNRFVHVVPGGDYGYKSLYGGAGNHPFQGWDGGLPGTLPYIDGTGEAPSGLLDCARAALPIDYREDYLVTIWNEHTIARYETRPRGVSLEATHIALVTGGQDFRPVAIDADSRGDIYITDWVLVDYPNHGRGRIWKLSTKAGVARTEPTKRFAVQPDPAFAPFEALLNTRRSSDFDRLRDALGSDDPFLRHAAIVALKRLVFRRATLEATEVNDPKIRLGALLALRHSGVSEPEPVLKQALKDPDPEVCRAALIWIGDSMLSGMRPDIDVVLTRPRLSPTLFETWLATVENLDPAFANAYRAKSRDKANQIKRTLAPSIIDGIIRNTNYPSAVRALALTRLNNPADPANVTLLLSLADSSEPTLAREAIRTLARTGSARSADSLTALALDASRSPEARAESLAALGWAQNIQTEPLLALLDDPSLVVRVEAVRLLARDISVNKVRDAFVRHLRKARSKPAEINFARQLDHALHPPGMETAGRVFPRPDSPADWQRELATGGDPVQGNRLFFSAGVGCSDCHTINNRGAHIGPDLSNLGQSVRREQIIRSILRPSDEFAPQWQAWFVETKDGELHQGLQLDHKAGGAIELFTTAGRTERFNGAEIARYGVRQSSLMPDGLEVGLSVEDFRNLVAFLESAK